MRRREIWQPTKFVNIDGELRGDPTGTHLSVGSLLIGDLMAKRYADALKQYARGRFLDLGCGNAPLYGVYSCYVDEVICADWPSSLHKTCHVDLCADLTCPLPFADSCFDTVLLSDVLEHIPNPEMVMTEIARVLCPAGNVVLGVPFLYP